MPRFAITFATSWEITWGGASTNHKTVSSETRRSGFAPFHSPNPFPRLGNRFYDRSNRDPCSVQRGLMCGQRFELLGTIQDVIYFAGAPQSGHVFGSLVNEAINWAWNNVFTFEWISLSFRRPFPFQ